jgi:hypothetical protein
VSFENRQIHHTPFQAVVTQYLQEAGFAVGSLGYHDSLSRELCDRLARTDTPTAELVRNGADLVAAHETLPLVLLVEVKTHTSQRYHDLTAEARQFVQRIREADHGALCLFCYRDPAVREVGFWMHQLPIVREALIPARWDGEQTARFADDLNAVLTGVPVRVTRATNGGSDTPFVVIDERELRKLPHWTEQIADVQWATQTCNGGGGR